MAKSVLVSKLSTLQVYADNVVSVIMGVCPNSHSHSNVAGSLNSIHRLSKYAAITRGEKDLAARFRATLGLPHPPTEEEKSRELQENAEKEEREHQERIERMKKAEEEVESEEGKERVRKEVLFGER